MRVHSFRDLFLPGSFGRQLEELGRLDAQDIDELADDLDPDLGHPSLDFAHVSPVHFGFKGQLLLRNPFLMADTPQVGCQDVPEVHALQRTRLRSLNPRL